MTQQLTRRRFTVADYHRMGEAGILTEDDRVELVGGEIVQMSPIGSRHNGTVIRLTRLFVQQVGDRATVSVQGPVRLGDHDEPVPDLLLLRPRADDYTESLPTAAEVLLVVEVADPSLEHDRDVKGPLYARAGIPEYWLWDIGGRRVILHRHPTPDGYARVRLAELGDVIHPEVLPAIAIATADLF